MQQKMRFSDFTPSKKVAQTNSQFRTHIVWNDVEWDWKPLAIEVSSTWNNLQKRARGEA
ncbi:MAG: hypothetical protein ACPHDO_03310 [Candidatus Poseidoniaceae archaeon]